VESVLPDNATARIIFASSESDEQGNVFLLDLDYHRPCETSSLDEILEVADELKNEENTEFELRITEATRALF
jgi:hypothetical protein